MCCGQLGQTVPGEGVLTRPGKPLPKLCSKTRGAPGDFPQRFRPRRPPAVFPVTLEEVLNIAIQDTSFDKFWLGQGVLSVVFLHDAKRESLQGARSRSRCGHTKS